MCLGLILADFLFYLKLGFPIGNLQNFRFFQKMKKIFKKKIAGLQFSRQGAMLLDSDPLHQMAKI